MNRAAVNVQDLPLPGWSDALGDALSDFALKVLGVLERDNWDLSILLCGDKTIKALNTQYRNRPEPTDVLSFQLGAETPDEDGVRYLPGDIVISLDSLRENAQYFETSEDEELRRLLIHGILHLDGMDHKANDNTEPMIALQEEILKKLKEEHILPNGGEK